MSTLLSAELEANIAECSDSRSFRVQEPRDDHINELKILQNETVSDEAFSFQIRHFVSTVRRRDFSKCWPFRQKILEKCLSVGLKPFLPPLEPLLKGCDEGEYGLSSPREDEGLCEESKEGCTPVLIEKLPTGEQEGDCVPGTNFSEVSNGDRSTGVDLAKSCADQLVQEMGKTTSERFQDNELGVHASAGLCDMNRSDCGAGVDCHGNLKQNTSLLAENNNSFTVKDADFHGSNDNEFDSGSAFDAGLGFNSVKDGSLRNIQQHHKGKFKSLSNESPVSETQVGSLKSNTSKVGKVLQFEAQLSSERLTILDHATGSCTERITVGIPPRLERNFRNGDDSSFTGLNLDALVPQVCPVCLNFTSTSNTALNAHIDHCLESVLPGEKGESRANKHRIKPRKMRSMVDICATAPTRTLEDLERSSKLWALNDEAPKESSSCSPSWTSGLVRRQPRTSLHRGLAWKARSSLETDDTPQVSASEMQPQLGKSQREGFIAKQHEMRGWIQETAVTLESFEGQQLNPEEPSGTLHAASPVMHLEQLTLAKKKKKRVLTNVILSKEVVMSEECSLSNKEDEDQRWSVSLDLLGFTVIDTSAEEERRLLQKAKCPNGEDTEAGKIPREGFVEDIGSKSGKFFKQQFSKGPPFSDLTSKKLDHKSSNDISKKRLRTPIESAQILSNGETSGEDDEVVFQLLSERPIKSKKAAPKIMSLLTVVANSCKEKEKDAIEGLGSQKTIEVQEKSSICGINTAPSGGSSGCQETRSKRRSLTSVHEDTREGCCELSKRARICPEKPTSSEDLHLYSLSEHGKSLKQNSLSSGRAQIEEEELYTDCTRPQQDIRQFSLAELDDGNLREEGLGSLTSLLSMHQAEGKNSSHVSEKRNNVITVASTKDILVKAPLCSTEISDLSEIGASLCRSGYDSLRKASTTPSNEVCVDNREEVSKKTSKGAEQTSKIHSSVSQRLTAGNSGGSGIPFATFSNVNPVETDPRRGLQMLPAIRKSFFPENATNCRPVNNLRTKQPLYDSLAASNFPMPISKNTESSQWYENAQSQVAGMKVVKDNGRPQAVAEGFENSGQCKLKCSAQHGARQVFRAGDLYERSGLNPNDIPLNRENVRILDNGNHFVMNKMDHMQGHHDLLKARHHHQHMHLGSRFSSSDLSPVFLSSPSESLQENGHVGNCDSNGHDYTPMSAISNERMSLPSSLLADLARSLATDSRKAQETLQRSNGFSGEQQRTLQASYHCTNKSLTKGREYSNRLPLQGAGKCCVPSASNGTVQPHVLHTAVQALKANTSIINPECLNGMGGSVTVSQKVHNTLPSVSPFRADPSSSCMSGTRESFLGAELASNLSNYGTVEYPVDQGVVHIFGNPVFKLMGQNVIVTSNSIKALGSCDQNGVQHFHPSSSIRHLGVLPETQNHYAHNLNPEVYSSTRLEAWHGDPCMSRSHSFMMDNLEIQSQARQNLPPTKSVHLKMPAHKDPVIFKPQMPMCILDEGSRSLRSTRELVMKNLPVVNTGSKMSTEVVIDPLPCASSSLPAGPSRVSGMVAQQSGRQFTTNNCSLPQNEQQSRAFPVQSNSATYLEDIRKLDGSGCSTRYRSGTLADIVQSSERSNS